MKLAVILFNLGGPATQADVRPFLRAMFSDPAIIGLPLPLRFPLARLISGLRAPAAMEIYRKIGGGSPLLANTQAQAAALQIALGDASRVFIAMRYASPRAEETARAVAAYAPDLQVLLPLYPQYSRTTTGSAFAEWTRISKKTGLSAPVVRIQSYPKAPGLISALEDLCRRTVPADGQHRFLFSAHGLPEKIIASGDPYAREVEETSLALAAALGISDFSVCYQSRLGPMRWIGPSIGEEIARAGRDGKAVAVVPVSFVSEHAETLVELDMEYAEKARALGVPGYWRVPAPGAHPDFIGELADQVRQAIGQMK